MLTWNQLTIGAILLLTGCSDWSYTIQKDDSYVIHGRNYTYAIYNGDHKLMTHPLEDLHHQLEYRKNACPEKPVTDIYVVSHGWNYTATEAVANYHNYIQLIDEEMRASAREEATDKKLGLPENAPMIGGRQPCPGLAKFQPFFVFISWASTAEPASEFANAILPFQLDKLLRPITFTIDNGPLFLATAWKQSLNASANAIGRGSPDSYLVRNWYGDQGSIQTKHTEDASRYGTNSFYYDDEKTGRDLPVSTFIYELIKCKPANPAPQHHPCLLGNDGLGNTKIHLVGHSYGAKLVALAGIEALRRHLLVHFSSSEQSGAGSPLYSKIMTTRLPKIPFWEQERATAKGWWCPIILGCPVEDAAELAIEEIYKKQIAEHSFPIESLVMLHPAMHSGEFWYSASGLLNKVPANLLTLIPRKAIVYSKDDFANGTLFNLRELILNTQISRSLDSLQTDVNSRLDKIPYGGALPARLAVNTVLTPLSLGYSLLYGAYLYSTTTATNLLDLRQPGDVLHHVLHNDSLGNPEWLDPKHTQQRSYWGRRLRYAYNTVDYFLPIYPLGPLRQEDKQGILRMSRPALGKTGVVRVTAGRSPDINLMGLESFYSDDKTPDYSAEVFCRFSYWDSTLDTLGEVDSKSTRTKIYSFDASKVFNSKDLLAGGSHSDLRNFDGDLQEEDGIRCDLHQKSFSKRKYGFKFVFRFTKTTFEQTADQIADEVLTEEQNKYMSKQEH